MRYLMCILLVLTSPFALAEWQLDGDTSRISFVSVKRGKMAEVQRFESRRAEQSAAAASLDEAKPQVALDAAYQQRATLAAERRAVQAGARLAALLVQLGKAPAQFKSDGLRPRP